MLPTAVLKEMCPLLGLDTASIMSMVEGGENGPSRCRLRGPGGKRLGQVGPDVYRVSHTPRSPLTLPVHGTQPSHANFSLCGAATCSHHVLIFASCGAATCLWGHPTCRFTSFSGQQAHNLQDSGTLPPGSTPTWGYSQSRRQHLSRGLLSSHRLLAPSHPPPCFVCVLAQHVTSSSCTLLSTM